MLANFLPSHACQGFELSAAFVCVFSADDGSVVMSQAIDRTHACLQPYSKTFAHSLYSPDPPANSTACQIILRPHGPFSILTFACSIPQRAAAASRTTRFSLASGGLVVFSSLAAANFLFTECIASLQPLAPAHAVVFDVSGFGERLQQGAAPRARFSRLHQGSLQPPCTLQHFSPLCCCPLQPSHHARAWALPP